MSVSFDVKGREMVVQTPEGVTSGRLGSYYECPKCRTALRFIAFFEDGRPSALVVDALKRTRQELHVSMMGKTVVGSAGVLNGYGDMTHHGYKGSAYGYGSYGSGYCSHEPYLGSDHQLASDLWNAICRRVNGKEDRPFPLTKFDISKVPGVVFAEDQLESGMPRLLLYPAEMLRAPTDHLVKRWDTRERWEDYERRLKRLPQEFLKTIAA